MTGQSRFDAHLRNVENSKYIFRLSSNSKRPRHPPRTAPGKRAEASRNEKSMQNLWNIYETYEKSSKIHGNIYETSLTIHQKSLILNWLFKEFQFERGGPIKPEGPEEAAQANRKDHREAAQANPKDCSNEVERSDPQKSKKPLFFNGFLVFL